jgi:hypothetical protein
MTNEQLKKICVAAYTNNNVRDTSYDLLTHWSGKETDITVMRLAADLAFDALQNNNLDYARAFREIIHVISQDSLNNDGAYSIAGIYF